MALILFERGWGRGCKVQDFGSIELSPDPVVQSIMSPIGYQGVMSLILARPHTSMEIDHGIYGHFRHSADSRRLLSVTSKCMCTVLVNR